MPWLLRHWLKGEDVLIDQRSHWDTNFFSGERLPADLPTPVEFALDLDSEGRRLATFYTTPAFVARRSFLALLRDAGVDNVDAYPAVIHDDEAGTELAEYVVLNIVGRLAAADLAAEPGFELGPGIRVLDQPVLRPETLVGAPLIFRLAEDPLQIVVADALADRIRAAGFDDVHLAPLE